MDIKTHLLIKHLNNNGWRMSPNEKDKENLVIDLLKKGHKTREIAKMAHVSNTTVIKIRAKLRAEVKEEQQQGDQNKKPLSMPSQAFKLFLEGKPVVKVAIELDLTTDQALKIQSDYMVLRNMGLASRVLIENRKNLGAYLGLLDFVNENKIKVKELNHAVYLAHNLDNMKKEKSQLEFDIDTLIDLKKYYETELNEIKRKYYKIR
jgi:transposase